MSVPENGDRSEIAYSKIDSHHTHSYDYGVDGAAVEIYGSLASR